MSDVAKDTIKQGEVLFKQGEYDKAFLLFSSVLENDQENTSALNDAGATLAALGHLAEAAIFFETALQYEPTHEKAFFNLLDVLLQQDKHDLAKKAYTTYASAVADSPEKTAYHDKLFSDPSAPAPQPAAPHIAVRNKKSHICIVGQPRSGTTIFWKTFRQDSRLRCYDEPFRPHLRHHVEAGADDRKETMAEYLSAPDLIREHWSTIQPYEEPYPALVGHQKRYLEALLATGTHVCMDFVRCCAKVEQLRQLMPDALIIHLVRDPRAWITSHLKPYGEWLPGLPEGFFSYTGWFDFWSRQKLAQYFNLQGPVLHQLMQMWQFLTDKAEQAGPDMTIQFETFATQPQPVVEAVYDRLTLPYEPLSLADVHPPNPPHCVEDPRWEEVLQACLSEPNRRFLYPYPSQPSRSAA